jgi:hypothetical protein
MDELSGLDVDRTEAVCVFNLAGLFESTADLFESTKELPDSVALTSGISFSMIGSDATPSTPDEIASMLVTDRSSVVPNRE